MFEGQELRPGTNWVAANPAFHFALIPGLHHKAQEKYQQCCLFHIQWKDEQTDIGALTWACFHAVWSKKGGQYHQGSPPYFSKYIFHQVQRPKLYMVFKVWAHLVLYNCSKTPFHWQSNFLQEVLIYIWFHNCLLQLPANLYKGVKVVLNDTFSQCLCNRYQWDERDKT